jgi:hypothetical protein
VNSFAPDGSSLPRRKSKRTTGLISWLCTTFRLRQAGIPNEGMMANQLHKKFFPSTRDHQVVKHAYTYHLLRLSLLIQVCSAEINAGCLVKGLVDIKYVLGEANDGPNGRTSVPSRSC